MDLPEDDEAFLDRKAHRWKLIPGGCGGFLVVKDLAVSTAVFDRDKTDLMIRIPAGYNTAGLDMYYVDPPLRLKNGTYPQAAEQFEEHVGRRWQRFSRHLASPWRPGLDGLPMFFALILKELQPKG
ncbi:MAG TPA: E2/UBC family protein [Gemmataceae bacterium]|nr:E2/UBC family protein [Gemmataceae bacterium]